MIQRVVRENWKNGVSSEEDHPWCWVSLSWFLKQKTVLFFFFFFFTARAPLPLKSRVLQARLILGFSITLRWSCITASNSTRKYSDVLCCLSRPACRWLTNCAPRTYPSNRMHCGLCAVQIQRTGKDWSSPPPICDVLSSQLLGYRTNHLVVDTTGASLTRTNDLLV